MSDSRELKQLMRCLIQVVGRAAVPEEKVIEIVGPLAKQRKAFNLADGTRQSIEIAKKVGIDQGNFSRTTARWVESGVAFWIGDGKDARLVHIYPITSVAKARRIVTTRKRRRRRG